MFSNPERLFSLANAVAMLGWLVLLTLAWSSNLRQRRGPVLRRLAGRFLPLALAGVYLALLLVALPGASGGFSTLAGVAQLFQSPMVLLAGWVHYLAFDLFVGAWISQRAERLAVHPLLTTVALLLTFLFGPLGFGFFLLLTAFDKEFASEAV